MRNALLILVLCITIYSCGDEFVDSRHEALTTGFWKMTGYVTDYHKDGVYEEDSYAILDGCIKDNIYTFQVDGSAIIDEGLVKCESSYPQTTTSSWNFSDNETRLQFRGENYHIEELTETTLQLTVRVSYNAIFTIDVKSTYTKQ